MTVYTVTEATPAAYDFTITPAAYTVDITAVPAADVVESTERVFISEAERTRLAGITPPPVQTVINVTTSRALAATDIGAVLHCSANVTLTLTQAVLTAMSQHVSVIEIYAASTSPVVVVPDTGITVRRAGTGATSVQLYGRAAIFKVAPAVGVLQGALV